MLLASARRHPTHPMALCPQQLRLHPFCWFPVALAQIIYDFPCPTHDQQSAGEMPPPRSLLPSFPTMAEQVEERAGQCREPASLFCFVLTGSYGIFELMGLEIKEASGYHAQQLSNQAGGLLGGSPAPTVSSRIQGNRSPAS